MIQSSTRLPRAIRARSSRPAAEAAAKHSVSIASLPEVIVGVIHRRRQVEQELGAFSRIVPVDGERLLQFQDRSRGLATVQQSPRLLRQKARGQEVVSGVEGERADGLVDGLLLLEAPGECEHAVPEPARSRSVRPAAAFLPRLRSSRSASAQSQPALAGQTPSAEPQGADRLPGRSPTMLAPPGGGPASPLTRRSERDRDLRQPQ